MKQKIPLMPLVFCLAMLAPQSLFAMHIMEGFLPPAWCGFWGIIALPFIILGMRSIRRTIATNPKLKLLLAMVGAFAFALSALKLPSLTGSCSHPTGVGLGAIMFGPTAMSVIGLLVLLFQALLLAHGGLTSLGANIVSMAIVGPITSYAIYRLSGWLRFKRSVAVFLAAFFGDMVTYITTALQLGIAFPAENGGIPVSMVKFLGIFAFTQIPLAISEGILTVFVFNALHALAKEEMPDLHHLHAGAWK